MMMKEVPKRDCHAYKMRDSRFFTPLGNQRKKQSQMLRACYPDQTNKQQIFGKSLAQMTPRRTQKEQKRNRNDDEGSSKTRLSRLQNERLEILQEGSLDLNPSLNKQTPKNWKIGKSLTQMTPRGTQ